MTGYGRAQGSFSGGEISVEIKSVNNRYLDCGVKLPRVYSFAEEAVKSLVQKTISRGKVDVYITVNSAGAGNIRITLNTPVVEGYLSALRQIARDYGVQDDISVSSLSRFSDVFLMEKQEEDEQEVREADRQGHPRRRDDWDRNPDRPEQGHPNRDPKTGVLHSGNP